MVDLFRYCPGTAGRSGQPEAGNQVLGIAGQGLEQGSSWEGSVASLRRRPEQVQTTAWKTAASGSGVRPGLGFGSFHTARRTLAGYETMAMMRKGQVRNVGGRDMRTQASFVAELFQVAA